MAAVRAVSRRCRRPRGSEFNKLRQGRRMDSRHGPCRLPILPEADLGEQWKCRIGFIILVAGCLTLGPHTPSPAAFPPRVAGVVTALIGPQVTVIRPSASPRPLKVGDRLSWGDVVETPQDAIARILLNQRATVTVRELSRLELREGGPTTSQKRWRNSVASVRG